MKGYTLQILLISMLITLSVAQAQEFEALTGSSVTEVPIKGTIEGNGPVDLVITIFDRETKGRELYSVTKTLPVYGNTYFGMINVPDGAFRGRQTVYVEVARSSAPAIALEPRAQFTKPGGPNDKAFTLRGCSLCFSCGGSYPLFSGAFVTPGAGTSERGRACSGNVTSRIDFRPHLCCQTGSL
ncbi:MAG TPA: hypothetical protein VLE27_07765 [Thermoanaerobaculia bacterium]|nr:hypothetical protein [Thermoanaerobaculia bacterium]